MKWPTIELGECVTEMRAGVSLTGDEFTDAGFPVLHKGTIREGAHLVFDRAGKAHVPKEFATKRPKAIIDDRFVATTLRNLVRTGETLGFIAPVPEGQSFLLAQGAYGLMLDISRLDRRFLSHLSNADLFHNEVLKRMVGTTQVHIRNSQFLKVPIPLPPLAEQKRIAGILDAADALRAKRRAALAQLDALAQSLFLDLFGDPVTNPKGWEVVAFSGIGKTRLGKMLDKGKQTCEHLRPYLANTNVKWGRFDLADLREMDFDETDRIEFSLRRGDLLICEGGEVGRCAIWKGELEECYFQKAIHRCRVAADKAVPEYLMYYLWFMAERGGFKDFVSTSTIAHLTGEKLRNLPVPLPPLPLQQQFAAAVEAIERQKARHREQLAGLDALFASLQHRAFRGEL